MGQVRVHTLDQDQHFSQKDHLAVVLQEHVLGQTMSNVRGRPNSFRIYLIRASFPTPGGSCYCTSTCEGGTNAHLMIRFIGLQPVVAIVGQDSRSLEMCRADNEDVGGGPREAE